MNKTRQLTERQQWMQILAKAGTALLQFEDILTQQPYQVIRPPQSGMVMVRGRAGGTGQAFNLGEMTVTRCVVQLNDGRTGYSYVAGRYQKQAELAAIADALLQGNEHDDIKAQVIDVLAQVQKTQREQRAAEVAGSKVEFFTLIRGEA